MTADLTFSQLFQLYAPLAGLLVFAFFLGALANRVRTLERERGEEKDRQEKAESADRDQRDEIVRMGAVLGQLVDKTDRMDRTLSGVNRQLANIASGKFTAREIIDVD